MGHIPEADRVPTAPFVARYEELMAAGWTAAEIACRAGWASAKGKGDTSYLKRTLGLMSWVDGKGHSGRTDYLSYDAAVKLADAMNLDPVDVGL